jgi:DNA repair exonuclease SbcCD ATPase subunit/predicted phosphodiesterase
LIKIAHIADIHWRGLQRHDEYTQVFEDFFQKMESINPDLIVVAGDIVHSKTQGITPELVDRLRWWFQSLAKWKTIVILGNHDGLIHNKSRLDAISPIIAALNNKNIIFLKDSGDFNINGINFSNFSCFDEEGWSKCSFKDDMINIALYHGAVGGSILDTGMPIDGEVSLDMFKNYDFALLGDIHKRQFLDTERRIAYPGSTVQQNYGEDTEKGFLLWKIHDANQFDVKFHALINPKPFHTIEWKGSVSSTIDACANVPTGSRIRILNDINIDINQTRQLNGELKKNGTAEVVWKYNGDTSNIEMKAGEKLISRDNLRDPQTIRGLFKDYAKAKSMSDDAIASIDSIVAELIDSLPTDERLGNVKWSIKNLSWDNTYGYGADNSINFELMEGITGIFGRNAQGKSSIPGTIMYNLFNTTDRGPIKNLHIINTRKDYCKSSIIFQAGDADYKIERQSVRHQQKSGAQNAVTHLNLFKLDAGGNPVEDISGEQRKESDKVLRSLIGTPEDFLLTSFAAQGEMNIFLKERATARKNIISKFLNLHVFESLQGLAKEKANSLKVELNRLSVGRDISVLIKEKSAECEKIKVNIETSEVTKLELEKKVKKLRALLEKESPGSTHTLDDIKQLERDIESQSLKIKKATSELNDSINERDTLSSKLEKLEKAASKFDINELRSEIDKAEKVQSKIKEVQNQLKMEMDVIKRLENSVKKLQEVPCGDKFQSCKYIKDSHQDKELLPGHRQSLDNINAKLSELIESFDLDQMQETKSLYEKVVSLQAKLPSMKSTLSAQTSKVESLQSLLETLASAKDRQDKSLADMRASISMSDLENVKKMTLEASKIDSDITLQNKLIQQFNQKLGAISNELERLSTDSKKIEKIQSQWKLYETILAATGKDGIPLQIIASQLPKLNGEISKILIGVANFNVEIVANEDDGDLEIFIDYGDSRRPIELSSGMEKMISAIAIRAALIEISAIHKSDMFIIDEGFGALDDTNIEACTRLLLSLKRNFKNIILISHVDSIKDIVDNVIDISHNGIDAQVRY